MTADPLIQKRHLLLTGNPRRLAKSIYQLELPPEVLRSLPAQSLYLAIQENGLESSVETLLAASLEQLKLLLDFDLWQRDTFLEENFWQWLEAEESSEPLAVAEKILKVIDYKIVALMIARYVDVITKEEKSDTPPAPGFYTPDLGQTWLRVKLEDSHRFFLMNRFLALLFESDADLFYQLLAVPMVGTNAILEEEAYQDQQRRLANEGIPDLSLAAEIHAPLALNPVLDLIKKQEQLPAISDIEPIPALIAHSDELMPWHRIVCDAKNSDELAAESTLLVNAALVHYNIPVSEYTEVGLCAAQVRGAINIGLQKVISAEPATNLVEAVEHLGLKPFYRLGLTILTSLRKEAMLVKRSAGFATLNTEQQKVIEALTKPGIPACPKDFDSQLDKIDDKSHQISAELRPIEELSELESLTRTLNKICPASLA
jgi:hypothetical protein